MCNFIIFSFIASQVVIYLLYFFLTKIVSDFSEPSAHQMSLSGTGFVNRFENGSLIVVLCAGCEVIHKCGFVQECCCGRILRIVQAY